MNLFQKYGIKEVADVVFYSITTIGDEEFYTPVLFLDTLKVSTLEKAAEKVEAKGGKGNKKLITWNFGKEVTLNLEDALFSPASMSMIWGGKLNSKLSDYTSAIVKCNLANKYGDLHYSIKAYPSPALTDNEWEIVFDAAEKMQIDSGSGTDSPDIYNKGTSDEPLVDENRNTLIKKYFSRTMDANVGREIKELDDYSWDTTVSGEVVHHTSKNFLPLFNPIRSAMEPVSDSIKNLQSWGNKNVSATSWGTYSPRPPYSDYFTPYLYDVIYGDPGDINTMLTQGKIQEDGSYVITLEKALILKGYLGKRKAGSTTSEFLTWGEILEAGQSSYVTPINLTLRYRINGNQIYPVMTEGVNAISYSYGGTTTGQSYNSKQYFGFLSTIDDPLSFFVHYFGEENVDVTEYGNLISTKGLAMPQAVIQKIMTEITSLDKLGYIDTDIHDIEVIDRMEKCIVKNRNGLKISSSKQKQNLFRYYADDKTSTYTIYYDAKTMLPLFRIEDGKIDDGEDEFTIKMGTVYYKWTRTVKYKESENDAILGKTLVIDAETFPDAYKIVGETYIRNQKTGKDQRYQFTIFRANVSSDTSVTLEAEGDPTTFSMQIDVLTPPNDIMMELKQYDVEDDLIEGGTRIVPQKSKYTYTPANVEYIEEVAEKNEEIY